VDEIVDPDVLAARIESLIEELRGDARSRAVAERLVQSLMQFYGAAFARALDLVAENSAAALEPLAADPLVGTVMLLHDLHPHMRPPDLDQPEPASSSPLRLTRADGSVVPLARTGQSPTIAADSSS
jgi:hypothetical protein